MESPAQKIPLWFCFFLCPPTGAGSTETAHVLTCTAGTSGCLQTINEYWFAALLPFRKGKLPSQLLWVERGSLIWFWSLCWVCVQLFGSLLFVHSWASSCCPQALLKDISSVASTSVGALQSPDLQSPANRTLAYFSSCFSFPTVLEHHGLCFSLCPRDKC